jgi:hypothetical protein
METMAVAAVAAAAAVETMAMETVEMMAMAMDRRWSGCQHLHLVRHLPQPLHQHLQSFG